MSTYWYFECLSHAPALRSEEFTQHTGDRHYDRGLQLAANRPVERDNRYWSLVVASQSELSDAYFNMRARAFLSEHPTCRLGVVSEYGERAADIPGAADTPPTLADLADAVDRAAQWLEGLRESTGYDRIRRPSNYGRAADDLRRYALEIREGRQ